MKETIIYLYLTDNGYIANAIRKDRKMTRTPKPPFWSRVEDHAMYALLEFSASDFKYNHIDSPENMSFLDRQEDVHNIVYVNAFEPTEDGRRRFQKLYQASAIKNAPVRQAELDYFRINKIHAYENMPVPETHQDLFAWAEERINRAYTRCFSACGFDIRYELSLFTLFSYMEKRRKELACRQERTRYAVFNKDGHTIYAAAKEEVAAKSVKEIHEPAKAVSFIQRCRDIPPPGEYTLLELLEDADAKGISLPDAIDILFELYFEGIISFPLSQSNSISDKILKRRMPAPELFFGEYMIAASEAEFKKYPGYLKRNYQESGIVLLNVREFEIYYDNIKNRNKKIILDLIIRRNLAVCQDLCREETTEVEISWQGTTYTAQLQRTLQPGWKAIAGVLAAEEFIIESGAELEFAGWRFYASGDDTLCGTKELLRFLKLHCGADSYLQMKMLQSMIRSVYVTRIEGQFLLRKSERYLLDIVPDQLLQIDELVLLYGQVRRVLRESITKEEFRAWVEKHIAEMTEEIRKCCADRKERID